MNKLTHENIKLLPDNPGIYRIYVRCANNRPIKLQRFASNDPNGLLYIGRTSKQTLKKRLKNFLLTARQNSRTSNHSGALKYRIYSIIHETLKEHELYFDYEPCTNPISREKELLKEYRQLFGETPPLNG